STRWRCQRHSACSCYTQRARWPPRCRPRRSFLRRSSGSMPCAWRCSPVPPRSPHWWRGSWWSWTRRAGSSLSSPASSPSVWRSGCTTGWSPPDPGNPAPDPPARLLTQCLRALLAGLALATRRGAPHDRRVDVVQDDLTGHLDAGDVVLARHVEHHREEHLLEDGPQPAGAGAAQQCLLRDGLDSVVGELQLDTVDLEHPLVLLDQSVARLGEDVGERPDIERRHGRDDRQAPDELGDQPELHQVLGQHVLVTLPGLLGGVQLGTETQTLLAGPRLDDLLQTGERPADDEQHVGGVDLDELLVRVLAAALRGHGGRGALQDLEQRLLDPLAGDVAGDGRVLRLARDLVDLVDVDDAALGLLDVEVGGLDELQQDVLDILTDI